MRRLAVAFLVFAAVLARGTAATVSPTIETAKYKCWHNVVYGPREDLPDEGTGFKGRTGNWKCANLPWRMCRHSSAQKLDIYAPPGGPAGGVDVVVYLHAGTWSHCFDKDAVPSALRNAIVAKGAVMVSPGYILQTDNTMNIVEGKGRRDGATFARMLQDVDMAMSFLDRNIQRFGIEPRRYVLMGESAGAHLALLYAYDRANPSALSLGLEHRVKFDRVVDIVGPVDFLGFDDGRASSEMDANEPLYRMRTLFKWLTGLDDGASDDELRKSLDRFSPVNLVNRDSPETILAYGQAAIFLETDGVIPVSQMETLEKALARNSVKHKSRLFKYAHHGKVSTKGAEWIADAALAVE